MIGLVKSFGLLGGVLLLCGGCYRHAGVSSVKVSEPGVHVVSAHGTTSIVWNQGDKTRVCTLPTGGKKYAGHGYSHRKGGEHHARVGGGRGAHGGAGALLFRLCEARGNGDITVAQYDVALQQLLRVMKMAHGRPGHPGMMHGHHGGHGHGGKGKGHGRGPHPHCKAGQCGMPADSAPEAQPNPPASE